MKGNKQIRRRHTRHSSVSTLHKQAVYQRLSARLHRRVCCRPDRQHAVPRFLSKHRRLVAPWAAVKQITRRARLERQRRSLGKYWRWEALSVRAHEGSVNVSASPTASDRSNNQLEETSGRGTSHVVLHEGLMSWSGSLPTAKNWLHTLGG